jgi:hypothetical protein
MPQVDMGTLLPLYGDWSTEAATGIVKFTADPGPEGSHGMALLPKFLDDGILSCTIKLPEANERSAAFVIFRANGQSSYYAAGLGGWEGAYTLAEGRHLALTRLASAGNISNLRSGREYGVQIVLEGQRVGISVDGVTVIDYDRLGSNKGTGLGLFSFKGTTECCFGPMVVDDHRPKAFVAMQFSAPFNEVYRDAIRPLIDEIGYEPLRVDEISNPGIILNDIWRSIAESSIVIAEVSESNPNVYYEIGVAHALAKPTILLAQAGTKLPFDIGPHRCIFYNNTIPGRAHLVEALRASLVSLLGVPPRQTTAA